MKGGGRGSEEGDGKGTVCVCMCVHVCVYVCVCVFLSRSLSLSLSLVSVLQNTDAHRRTQTHKSLSPLPPPLSLLVARLTLRPENTPAVPCSSTTCTESSLISGSPVAIARNRTHELLMVDQLRLRTCALAFTHAHTRAHTLFIFKERKTYRRSRGGARPLSISVCSAPARRCTVS